MEEGHQRFRCIFATIQFESAGHLVVEFTDNLWDLLQICSTERCPICLCPQSAPEPEFLKILEPKHGIRSSTGWFRKHRGTGWCGRPHCHPEAGTAWCSMVQHGTAARNQWLSSSCLLSLSLGLSCRRSRSKQRLRCRPHEQNRNILTFDLAAWRQQWYTVGV